METMAYKNSSHLKYIATNFERKVDVINTNRPLIAVMFEHLWFKYLQ